MISSAGHQIAIKFDIDQTVYFLHNAGIRNGKITRASVTFEKTSSSWFGGKEEKVYISYIVNSRFDIALTEDQIFATKQDLKDSLWR